MIVDTDHGKYKVKFFHDTPERAKKEGRWGGPADFDPPVSHMTVVTVTNLLTPDKSLTGQALCSKKDRFVRDTGRKLALTRALAPLKRELRKVFWEAYHGRKTKAV